jgi:mRNA interferase RelE/StbE
MIRRIGQLSNDPRPGSSRKLSGHDRYRIRQGNDCIVREIADKELNVTVVKVGNRKDLHHAL